MEEFKIQAKLAGFDLTDKDGKVQSVPKSKEELQKLPIFRAPEEYAHLSQEDREDLTKSYRGKHKRWRASKKALMDKRPSV